MRSAPAGQLGKIGRPLCLTLTTIGLILIGTGLLTPVFSDAPRAMDAFARWCDEAAQLQRGQGDLYWSFRTNHYLLINGGLALLLTGGAAFLVAAVRSGPASGALQSPHSRWGFQKLRMLVMLGYWTAAQVALYRAQQSAAFPWCRDTIVVPMVGVTAVAIVLTPLLMLAGHFISRAFAELPVALFAWNAQKPIYSAMVTLIAAVVLLLPLAAIALDVVRGEAWFSALGAPTALMTIYLVEATRSALIVRETQQAPIRRRAP